MQIVTSGYRDDKQNRMLRPGLLSIRTKRSSSPQDACGYCNVVFEDIFYSKAEGEAVVLSSHEVFDIIFNILHTSRFLP